MSPLAATVQQHIPFSPESDDISLKVRKNSLAFLPDTHQTMPQITPDTHQFFFFLIMPPTQKKTLNYAPNNSRYTPIFFFLIMPPPPKKKHQIMPQITPDTHQIMPQTIVFLFYKGDVIS